MRTWLAGYPGSSSARYHMAARAFSTDTSAADEIRITETSNQNELLKRRPWSYVLGHVSGLSCWQRLGVVKGVSDREIQQRARELEHQLELSEGRGVSHREMEIVRRAIRDLRDTCLAARSALPADYEPSPEDLAAAQDCAEDQVRPVRASLTPVAVASVHLVVWAGLVGWLLALRKRVQGIEERLRLAGAALGLALALLASAIAAVYLSVWRAHRAA